MSANAGPAYAITAAAATVTNKLVFIGFPSLNHRRYSSVVRFFPPEAVNHHQMKQNERQVKIWLPK
jgi:hypothetical protein